MPVVVAMAAAGCGSEAHPEHSSGHDALDRFLADIPTQVVDLDCCAAEIALPLRVVGSDGRDPFLGAAKSVDIEGDSLLLADYRQNVVVWAHRDDAHLARAFGRPGRGPGEFGRVESAVVEAGHLFVADPEAGGIHAFGPDGAFLETLRVETPLWYSVAAGGGMLAHGGSEALVDVRAAEPPFAISGSLLPRLDGIPHSPVLSVSDQGEMVVAYYGLPVLFVVDRDLTIRRAISLKSAAFEQRLERSDPSRTYTLFFGLALSAGGEIAVSTPEGTYVLTPFEEAYTVRRHLDLRLGPDSEDTFVPFGMRFDADLGGFWAVSRSSSEVYLFGAEP